MTDDEIKRALKPLHDVICELWLENQLLRNLIIDSHWMPEDELDAGIEKTKNYPENTRLAAENWAYSEQMLAELGLDEWLARFDKRFPHRD